ncbi:hypothetical protein ACQ86F_25635 [Streptomyces venezuelae ATCC 10712]
MIQLPTLRTDVHGILVLDDTASAHNYLRTLADLYREDPEGVGDALILIADLGDAAEEVRCSGGCDCAGRARDGMVDNLLVDMGVRELSLTRASRTAPSCRPGRSPVPRRRSRTPPGPELTNSPP